MDLLMRHRELIAAVNNAKTEYDHRRADAFLEGWRAGIGDANGTHWMRVIDWTDADMHHEGTAAERPMCIGVFLDWKPQP